MVVVIVVIVAVVVVIVVVIAVVAVVVVVVVVIAVVVVVVVVLVAVVVVAVVELVVEAQIVLTVYGENRIEPVGHGGEVDKVFMQCFNAVVFCRALRLSLDSLIQCPVILRAPLGSSLQINQRILQYTYVCFK